MPRRRHVPRAWCARRGRAPAARVEAIVEPSSFCSSRPHSVSTCGGGLQPCGTRTTRAPRAHHDCRAHGARVGQRAQLHERATCALTLPTRSGRASRTLHPSRRPNLSPPHIHTHNGARSTPPVIDGESEGLTPCPMPCSHPSRAQRQGLLSRLRPKGLSSRCLMCRRPHSVASHPQLTCTPRTHARQQRARVDTYAEEIDHGRRTCRMPEGFGRLALCREQPCHSSTAHLHTSKDDTAHHAR